MSNSERSTVSGALAVIWAALGPQACQCDQEFGRSFLLRVVKVLQSETQYFVCDLLYQNAASFGVHDHQVVSVKVDSQGRDLEFGDVVVRVAEGFELELHLDTDEANAAGVRHGDFGELVIAGPAST